MFSISLHPRQPTEDPVRGTHAQLFEYFKNYSLEILLKNIESDSVFTLLLCRTLVKLCTRRIAIPSLARPCLSWAKAIKMTTQSPTFEALGTDLTAAISNANNAATKDEQIVSFLRSEAITVKATFAAQAAGSEDAVLIDVSPSPSKVAIRAGNVNEASFVLSALPEQWREFFKQTPTAPYQSYWGLIGMNNRQEGIDIRGDMSDFAHWAPVWRRGLELLHNAYAGPYLEEEQPETDEDAIVGRYLVLKDIPLWGRSKVYVSSVRC